jgi:NADH-quinone oxidoreductase subunit J
MPTELLVFYVLAAGVVLSTAAMLLPPMGRNPIHSAIALIVSFFFLAGIYALLSAHLLAAVQIIVYAGAVMVLFTFVIMLLNLTPDQIREPRITATTLIGSGLGLFVFGKLLSALALASNGAKSVDLNDGTHATFGSVTEVGRMLYTTFLVPFELVSVLLLVAAVGAVVLAKRSLKYKDRPKKEAPAAHAVAATDHDTHAAH